MGNLMKLSFVATLLYLIILQIRVALEGYAYDKAKRKIDENYNRNHSVGKLGTAVAGRFVIPFLINDNDPVMIKNVTRYNKLTKIYWVSVLVGVPLLIFLGTELNRS